MEGERYIQKINPMTGEAFGPPRPLYGDEPFKPLTVSAEGIEAVAGALGIKSPSAAFDEMADASPEERFAEGMRRLTQGGER